MDLMNIVAFDYSGPGERKWKHRQKMERKELDRYERGMRRTMEWERRKVQAPWMIERERKWLKSPYAFRRGGL